MIVKVREHTQGFSASMGLASCLILKVNQISMICCLQLKKIFKGILWNYLETEMVKQHLENWYKALMYCRQFGLPHCNPDIKTIPLTTSSIAATARLWNNWKGTRKNRLKHTLVTVSLLWSTDGALLFFSWISRSGKIPWDLCFSPIFQNQEYYSIST